MTERCRVYLVAEMPSELLQQFLQALRDFDAEHGEVCAVGVTTVSGMPVEEVVRVLGDVNPPIPINIVSKKH